MKKIIALISIISIVGVLASCGKEEATTEPKPKTCEQMEPCKTALKYATYYEQGSADKAFKMETKEEGVRSYSNIDIAKDHIKSDYEQYKHKQIKEYGVLEYSIIPGEKYIYKFRFKDFRTGELKNFTTGVSKHKDKYLTNNYVGGATKKDITVNGTEIGGNKTYYSKGLTAEEKQQLTPLPIEN